MAGVSAVAFDLDGTLLDHRTASARAFAHLVSELGGTVTPGLERAWWAAEGRHFDAWRRGRITFAEQRRRRLRDILPLGRTTGGRPGGQGGAPEALSDGWLDGVFAVYLRAYEEAWCVFPEVIAVLDAVRAAGVAVGLLTNGSQHQQERKLALTLIRNRFDVVCTSEALGVSKPDPRAFEALCARLRVPASAVLFVGDDYEADILGARAAGLRTYFVDRSGDGRADVGAVGRGEAAHRDLLGLVPLLG